MFSTYRKLCLLIVSLSVTASGRRLSSRAKIALSDDLEQELWPQEDYERHVGKFLVGYAAGDSKRRSSSAAQSRCDELGNACRGYTCDAAENTCTVRAGNVLKRSPASEVSYVKGSDDNADADDVSAPSDVSADTLAAWKKVPNIDICNLPSSFSQKVQEMRAEPEIVKRMRALNYKVHEEPGHANVASVRVKSPKPFTSLSGIYSNTFRDKMYIFWRACDGSPTWMIYQTSMTTVPGTGKKGLEGRSLTSALTAGQYHNVYCKGTHGGNAAMRHASEMKQWLVLSNGRLKYSNPSSKKHSLNFHGTTYKGTTYESTRVKNWSHGCQVTSGRKFYDEVLALIFSSSDKYPEAAASMRDCQNQNSGGRTDCNRCITYTLIEPE